MKTATLASLMSKGRSTWQWKMYHKTKSVQIWTKPEARTKYLTGVKVSRILQCCISSCTVYILKLSKQAAVLRTHHHSGHI